MSIIKVEIRLREIPVAIEAFRKGRKNALDLFSDEIRRAVSSGFNQLMNTEIDLFFGDDFLSYIIERVTSLSGITF